jgi:hypothetical protein
MNIGEHDMYNLGDRVFKYTGDYQLEGEVRDVFYTKAGKVRYVVEHDMGICHIYSDANLKLVE